MMFEDFSLLSSGGHFAQRSGNIWAIMVEGVMRNTSMKIF